MTASYEGQRPTGLAAPAVAAPSVGRPPAQMLRTPQARTDEDAKAAFAEERRRLREGRTLEPRRGRIGWKFGIVLDVALLSLPIPAVIAVPPVLECRHRSIHVGFFAGDSFEACVQRRIIARWNHLDARIKMIVRNSGQ